MPQVTLHLHKESEKIRIKRGVRQGDTISPKLFTATLESIFRMLNWENKGVKIDREFLSTLLMTYSYPQKHHKNYNRCYKNYPIKVDEWVLRWTSQRQRWCYRQHPYKREQCADRKCSRLRVLGTTLQPQGKEPGQRDTTKNHGRLGGIRQTQGYLQKQPCHLPEKTGVQLLCGASYDIIMVQRPGHWPNKHRTNLRPHRPKWKEVSSTLHTKLEGPTSGSGRGQKSSRYKQHCEKNEMVLGRAYQPPQRRPMDLACHHLETIWQEKTTRKTSQAVERRPGQILERHDMAEDSTRHGNLETTYWGLRPTTGHHGCPIGNYRSLVCLISQAKSDVKAHTLSSNFTTGLIKEVVSVVNLLLVKRDVVSVVIWHLVVLKRSVKC